MPVQVIKVSSRLFAILSTSRKFCAAVVVAMSGGVDSSVTAALLARHDFDLSATFMRNWDTKDELGDDGKCEWEKDWHDVQRVCKMFDIPCQLVDLSKEYWLRVFEPSLRLWEQGMTPNPDTDCNRYAECGESLYVHSHRVQGNQI